MRMMCPHDHTLTRVLGLNAPRIPYSLVQLHSCAWASCGLTWQDFFGSRTSTRSGSMGSRQLTLNSRPLGPQAACCAAT
jgi:hypothetical protein